MYPSQPLKADVMAKNLTFTSGQYFLLAMRVPRDAFLGNISDYADSRVLI